MLRIILLVLVLLLAVTVGIAFLLYHFMGLTGLLIFPLVLVAMAWIGFKMVGFFVKRLGLALFGMKSKVLHNAGIEVHSVTPVSVARRIAQGELEEGDGDADEDEEDGDDGLKHYYAVDLTVTPQGNSSDRVWEPGEFILLSKPVSSLTDMEGNEVGSTHEVRVWNGTEFGEDDPGKYPGSKRLKVTFAVKPGTTRSWLHYYNETIGEINLPAWKVDGLTT